MHPRTSTWCSLRTLGPVLRCAIVVRGGGYCAWCRAALTQSTCEIDHVVPRREGGRSTLDNLVPSCAECNLVRPDLPGDLAQLSQPVDRWMGLQLALVWYPWMAARLVDRNRRSKAAKRRAYDRNREAASQGLGGEAFPFGRLA